MTESAVRPWGMSFNQAVVRGMEILHAHEFDLSEGWLKKKLKEKGPSVEASNGQVVRPPANFASFIRKAATGKQDPLKHTQFWFLERVGIEAGDLFKAALLIVAETELSKGALPEEIPVGMELFSPQGLHVAPATPAPPS